MSPGRFVIESGTTLRSPSNINASGLRSMANSLTARRRNAHGDCSTPDRSDRAFIGSTRSHDATGKMAPFANRNRVHTLSGVKSFEFWRKA
ncbi:MAG: hypothetical protein RIS70_1139 [Planctomycetota bacterium]|jgi:hypothetical protein